jgi:hypothetical protein
LRAALAEHTPWARAEFARSRLWMACSCGWNNIGTALTTWNEHFVYMAKYPHALSTPEATYRLVEVPVVDGIATLPDGRTVVSTSDVVVVPVVEP